MAEMLAKTFGWIKAHISKKILSLRTQIMELCFTSNRKNNTDIACMKGYEYIEKRE